MKAVLAVLAAAAAVCGLLAAADDGQASPYGGMSVRWQEENGDNQWIRFRIELLLDGAKLGMDAGDVGRVVPAWEGLSFDFGDGTTQDARLWTMRIVSHDPDTGFLLARILGLDGREGFTHIYTTPWQSNGDPWPATAIADSRRLAGDDHANNPGTIATVTAPIALGDILPEASVETPSPHIVRCAVDAPCLFDVKGRTKPGGPTHTFLTGPGTASLGGTFDQPGPPETAVPLTIGAFGNVTWHTRGATPGSYHSLHVTHAYDAQGRYYATGLDMMVYIDPDLPPPPEPVVPVPRGRIDVGFTGTSPCGASFRTMVNTTLRFTVGAWAEEGHNATLLSPDVPGLSAPPVPPAPQPQLIASWTPPHVGSWLAWFSASTEDNDTADGTTAKCPVRLESFDLVPSPHVQQAATDTGPRTLAWDAAEVPQDVTIRSRTWTTSEGTAQGNPAWLDLQPGKHEVCLTIEGDHAAQSFTRHACRSITVGPAPEDTDLDGAPDLADNCPAVPEQQQRDHDNDGIGDACQHIALAGQTGASVLDHDRDGIPTAVDACPTIPDTGEDLDRDGIPDACDKDLDGDGIVNSLDNCPLVPNAGQEDLDRDRDGDHCAMAMARLHKEPAGEPPAASEADPAPAGSDARGLRPGLLLVGATMAAAATLAAAWRFRK